MLDIGLLELLLIAVISLLVFLGFLVFLFGSLVLLTALVGLGPMVVHKLPSLLRLLRVIFRPRVIRGLLRVVFRPGSV